MSILCDHEIRDLINTKRMVENYHPDLINPASLDLRLGELIMIESAEDLNMRPLSIADRTADDPYWLVPGQFVLAETMELFNMPEDVAGLFFLKSSRAREGYEHSHAGYGDPGWHGSVLTLELKNVRQILPLPLYPGLKIGQMAFIRMSAKPSTSYATVGHYNGHKTVMGSVACHLPPLLVGCASGLPLSSPLMTDNNHPITPPPALVEQWYDAIDNSSTSWKQELATQAARRPKPPSLKEQALGALYAIATGADDTREFHQDLETIKQALESLPDV